jgi:hypothetical protein
MQASPPDKRLAKCKRVRGCRSDAWVLRDPPDDVIAPAAGLLPNEDVAVQHHDLGSVFSARAARACDLLIPSLQAIDQLAVIRCRGYGLDVDAATWTG